MVNIRVQRAGVLEHNPPFIYWHANVNFMPQTCAVLLNFRKKTVFNNLLLLGS
jgi:hypothetical protein